MNSKEQEANLDELDELARRFVARCTREWIKTGLPVEPLVLAYISSGLTAAVEHDGAPGVAAGLRRMASVLSVVES